MHIHTGSQQELNQLLHRKMPGSLFYGPKSAEAWGSIKKKKIILADAASE